MIEISTEELKKLKIVGTGTFSNIYRKDDKVYKIYKDEVKTDKFDELIENPLLKHKSTTIRRIKRLIFLNQIVKNTDLAEDLVFVDGQFYGIVLPYYDGKTLFDMEDSSFKDRIDYSYKIIKNAKELTDNHIYSIDFSLKNTMVVNDEIKLLDLDDINTKISNFRNIFSEEKSILAVDKVIKTLLNENRYRYYDKELSGLVEFEQHSSNRTYFDIRMYIDSKKIKKNILFLDETYNSCIDKVHCNKVVFTFDKYDIYYIIKCISKLKENDVIVDDVIHVNDIDNYIANSSYNDCLSVKGSKVLKLR